MGQGESSGISSRGPEGEPERGGSSCLSEEGFFRKLGSGFLGTGLRGFGGGGREVFGVKGRLGGGGSIFGRGRALASGGLGLERDLDCEEGLGAGRTALAE